MRLQGLYCVVTGGASGIGAATVRRFAAEGAHICILDRDLSAAEALAAELGDSHLAMELDVRFEEGVEQVAEAVYDRWGQVDVLVNNAGLGRMDGTLAQGTLDDISRTIDTNVTALMVATMAFLPAMIRRGSGHVVNLGSMAGGNPLSEATG